MRHAYAFTDAYEIFGSLNFSDGSTFHTYIYMVLSARDFVLPIFFSLKEGENIFLYIFSPHTLIEESSFSITDIHEKKI